MAKSAFLAFDIGASSGRAILGILENEFRNTDLSLLPYLAFNWQFLN